MKNKTVSETLTLLRLFFLFVLGTSLLNTVTVPLAQAEPTIYVDPPVSFAEPGESFNITISIIDAEDVYAWSVNMTFDPNILEFQEAIEGDFLASQPEGTSGLLKAEYVGYVFLVVSTRGDYMGVSGRGQLATVEFKAKEGITRKTVLNISDPGIWNETLGYHIGGTQLLDHLEREIWPRITVDGFFISTELLPFYNEFLALNSSYYSLLADYNNLLDDYDSLSADYDNLLDNYDTLTTNYNALNLVYFDLLEIYNQLQSGHNSLQENYDTISADFDTLTALHASLLTNYTTLQENYDSLGSDYNTLETDYDSLETECEALSGDLDIARNLDYLFIATTMIFIGTTVYLAIRKPKVKTELETT